MYATFSQSITYSTLLINLIFYIGLLLSLLLGMSRANVWVKHLGSLAIGFLAGLITFVSFHNDSGMGAFMYVVFTGPVVCRLSAYCGQLLRRFIDRRQNRPALSHRKSTDHEQLE